MSSLQGISGGGGIFGQNVDTTGWKMVHGFHTNPWAYILIGLYIL